MKKLLLGFSLLAALVITTTAQVTIPNTLVAGTTIRANDLNTNFSTLGSHALDRLAGGTLSGNVSVDPGITIDGVDIGAAVCSTCAPTFKDLVLTSPATGITVGGNTIINTTGKIPALSSAFFTTLPTLSATNFSSLAATNLTAIPSAQLTGALPAISGAALTNINGAAVTATVPVSSLPPTIAYVDNPNGFVVTQTFQGVSINSQFLVKGFSAGSFPSMDVTSGAFGAGTFGTQVRIGRNTSGGGSPGFLTMTDKGATDRSIWPDSTGVLRIGTPPNETSGDTIGTIVGTQSSSLDTKILLGRGLDPHDALSTLLATPVFQFRYKSGSYNGTTFQGIVADYSPDFAMDPDEQHPNGKSFNPVSAFGYTVQAIKALQAQIDELKEQLRHVKQ